MRFSFQCDQRWETLEVTDRPGVRFCARCDQCVWHAEDASAAQRHAMMGRCVSLVARGDAVITEDREGRDGSLCGGRDALVPGAPGGVRAEELVRLTGKVSPPLWLYGMYVVFVVAGVAGCLLALM